MNASPSISGRYPNGGPIRIVAAGIPLLDAVGPEVMDQIREGDVLELHDGALWRDDEKLAVGEMLVAEEIEARMEEARRTIGTELQTFARNTLEYIEKEAADHVRAAAAPAAARRRYAGATRSSSCAVTTTSTTSRRCARTSASTGRC